MNQGGPDKGSLYGAFAIVAIAAGLMSFFVALGAFLYWIFWSFSTLS